MSEEGASEEYDAPAVLLKRVVLFPHMEAGVTVKDQRNLAAVRQAMEEHHLVVFVSHTSSDNLVGAVGTLVLVQKNSLTPRNEMQTLLRGLSRVRVEGIVQEQGYTRARFRKIEETDQVVKSEGSAWQRVHEQLEEFIKLIPGIPEEIITLLKHAENPGQLADLCAYSPEFTFEERLDLLQTVDPEERLEKVSKLFERQLEALKTTSQTSMIPDCETCSDLAEKAFEAEPNQFGEMISAFLNHVVQEHSGELLALLAEKYGPIFMMKRALR